MQTITANRLRDGAVVWLGANGVWVDDIAQAKPFSDVDLQAAQDEAAAAKARQEIIDPYAIPVALEDGKIVPQSFREAIRANGPTVRLDLGKQAGPQRAGE